MTEFVRQDVKENKLDTDEYCVMWLEDDNFVKDEDGFNKVIDKFLNDDKILVAPMYHNKINMGGNPDIIKGEVFKLFDDVDLNPNNKRDPEWIRKTEVFEPHIWIDPWPELNTDFGHKLNKCNPSDGCGVYDGVMGTDSDDYIHSRKTNYKVLSSDVVEGDIGDNWRRDNQVPKNWSGGDKPGISVNRSYTYE